MSVAIILVGRSWTSYQNTDLDDHIANDACLNGPTYVALSQIRQNELVTLEPLFRTLSLKQMANRSTWSCLHSPADVIAEFIRSGYTLIGQAGNGVGFSGKARYSADVAISDYRWSWTLVQSAAPRLVEQERPGPSTTAIVHALDPPELNLARRQFMRSLSLSSPHLARPIMASQHLDSGRSTATSTSANTYSTLSSLQP